MSAPSFRQPIDLSRDKASSGARRRRFEPGQIVALVMVAIVLTLLAVVLIAGGGDDTDEVPYDPDNASEARAQCEQLVEESLKAPATAEFGESTATRSGSEWIVTGSVDSENSFGAMLRNEFQCSVRVVDGTIQRRLDSFG